MAGDAQIEQVLASMPLRIWRTDEVTPLTPHPSDPGLAAEWPATSRSSPEAWMAISLVCGCE